MNELIADVTKALLEDPRIQPIKDGGGVITLANMDDWEEQRHTPAIVIIDPGGHSFKHLSSYVRDQVLSLEVHIVQRNFERHDINKDGSVVATVGALATIVKKVLDMNRLRAKYASCFLTGESAPRAFHAGYPQLQEKTLTFDYRRIESP